MNETIAYLPGLSPVENKELCARFDGGRLSSAEDHPRHGQQCQPDTRRPGRNGLHRTFRMHLLAEVALRFAFFLLCPPDSKGWIPGTIGHGIRGWGRRRLAAVCPVDAYGRRFGGWGMPDIVVPATTAQPPDGR